MQAVCRPSSSKVTQCLVDIPVREGASVTGWYEHCLHTLYNCGEVLCVEGCQGDHLSVTHSLGVLTASRLFNSWSVVPAGPSW